MKLLISGDRYFSDFNYIFTLISKYKREYEERKEKGKEKETLTIINGGCRGVDDLVTDVCVKLNIQARVYVAEWKLYGNKAGPVRNTRMITSESPDLIIALHPNIEDSKGTKNMINQGIKKGIPVILYDGKSQNGVVVKEKI